MKIVVGTHNAINSLTEEYKNRYFNDGEEYSFLASEDVYVNMICGWTEEECDNVLYIVEAEHLFKGPDLWIEKKIKND